jgi:hypothetical protein
MSNFYPNGAIKGRDQFEKLVEHRGEKDINLYLVNQSGCVYKIRLNSDTEINPYHSSTQEEWIIANAKFSSSFTLRINPSSDYLESTITGGYIFSNFWHAWAYANHLEQSGFTIDWRFPVGVG